VFINFNCTILDCNKVTIGAHTLLGPNVQLYAATHPLDPGVRRGTKGPELARPIAIGEDCWLGGGAAGGGAGVGVGVGGGG
jgi:acetyltransferase-like isoleucine patch superfamily enzyme